MIKKLRCPLCCEVVKKDKLGSSDVYKHTRYAGVVSLAECSYVILLVELTKVYDGYVYYTNYYNRENVDSIVKPLYVGHKLYLK
jgi:hypothetical protein